MSSTGIFVEYNDHVSGERNSKPSNLIDLINTSIEKICLGAINIFFSFNLYLMSFGSTALPENIKDLILL